MTYVGEIQNASENAVSDFLSSSLLSPMILKDGSDNIDLFSIERLS